jgi:dipeptidyl aminopeptidase/acylaminoacyl peptidase
VLILHGGRDQSHLVQQADELFMGLRRLGRKAVYVKYRDEGHWMGDWGYADQLDFGHRLIDWFDTNLKGSTR